jgi:hypothetical protein
MNFLKIYGDIEAPLAFPMGEDTNARALDTLLPTLPEQEYHHVVVQKATTEITPGSVPTSPGFRRRPPNGRRKSS